MWFKHIQIFRLTSLINSASDSFAEKLSPYAFTPCLPSFSTSLGWVSPLDDQHEPLARGINACIMFCLQIEDKILPVSVVNKHLKEKVSQIEMIENRKLPQKEKYSLKDEIVQTLLPRAFSKFELIHAYIDTSNGWLVINSVSPRRIEIFINYFKKTFGDVIKPFDFVDTSTILTHWLEDKGYPQAFSIERSCLLQDSNQVNRIIRCQQQDLFSSNIISFIKEGCEVKQLALCWQDRINFVINEKLMLRNIYLTNDDTVNLKDEMETKQQKFDADFVMMTMMYRDMLMDLLKVFVKTPSIMQSDYAKVG